ncbi:MAG: hypothetical protein Q7S24_01880 [bacterium]|nr:hypothetical protein [bacterium]
MQSGLSADDWVHVIIDLYNTEKDQMPALNFASASIILKQADRRNEKKMEVMEDVLRKFSGTLDEIKQLYTNDNLVTIAIHNWPLVSSEIKQDVEFWITLRNTNFNVFFDHYNERPASLPHMADNDQRKLFSDKENKRLSSVLLDLSLCGEFTPTPSEMDALIDNLIVSGVGVHFLSSQKQSQKSEENSQIQQKTDLYNNRVSLLLKEWRQNPEQAIVVLEKFSGSVALDDRFRSALKEMSTDLSVFVNQPEQLQRFVKVYSELAPQLESSLQADRLESLVMDNVNWVALLLVHLDLEGAKVSKESKEKIEVLFKKSETKDLCLQAVQDLWKSYLGEQTFGSLPIDLSVVSQKINAFGAGPLSQLEALGEFIHNYHQTTSASNFSSEMHQIFHSGTSTMEERLAKGRWGQEDRSSCYRIAGDVMAADPLLYTELLGLFNQLNPNQAKQYVREILPLYRAQLALYEKSSRNDTKSYDPDILVSMRADMSELSVRFEVAGAEAFTEKRDNLIEKIKGIFKEKFGIIKIPDNFNPDDTLSLANISVYLGNLSNRTNEREATLGFYLALMLNGNWEEFRAGGAIDPDVYLTAEKSVFIKRILEKRTELSPITANQVGVAEAEMPRFKRILQQEIQNVVIGEVQTIDVKLMNVLINLESLSDLDLYPDPLDKARLGLLIAYGNKKVGAVAAKMYQLLKDPGKTFQFSEEELIVRGEIERVVRENELELTPETVKINFQDSMKPLAAVMSVLNFTNESNATKEVEKIRDLLVPTAQIVEIFNRLGEEFKVSSGAMAVSQDLNYLENIVNKREKDLLEGEPALLKDYIRQIREQLVKLDGIYEQMKNKFAPLKQSSHSDSNPLFKAKLDEIDRIISTQIAARTITSTITNNFNSIIENIRECLSCKNQGCNNDTDLSFGDENKFFIYTQTEEKTEGSIADQIVFVEPVTFGDGSTGFSFVLDRMYGASTPDIFINHVKTVIKKNRQLHTSLPDSNLSVMIPSSVVATGGLTAEMLIKKLETDIGGSIEITQGVAVVSVAPSAVADHYIEFGGGSRTAGERAVEGIIIKIK